MPLTRRRIAVLAAVAAVVLVRSLVLVCWPQAHFDSDQAVTGLMAKHLAEGRAFPVFMYGQSYILAVQAWMAAPMFLLLGVSVAALKVPLLVINIAVAVLLIVLIEPLRRAELLHRALRTAVAPRHRRDRKRVPRGGTLTSGPIRMAGPDAVLGCGDRRTSRAPAGRIRDAAADRAKAELVQALEARGLRYGYADFWVAYYVSFMANDA